MARESRHVFSWAVTLFRASGGVRGAVGQSGDRYKLASLPEGHLLVTAVFAFGGGADEVKIEDEVGGGAFPFVEDLAEVFAPHFGITLVFLREHFGPLAEGAAGVGAFAEFGEPALIGGHGEHAER